MIHTHHTAPTQFVEANGVRFAYRRFGKPGAVPLGFNQHYTGTMDYWDPALTDRLARDREVLDGRQLAKIICMKNNTESVSDSTFEVRLRGKTLYRRSRDFQCSVH